MKLLITPFLCFLFLQLNSQNLVLNPSFEEPIHFDTAKTQGWHKVQDSDTPDYFNTALSNPKKDVFNTYMGGAKAKTGTGFIGLFCYRVQPDRNIRNIREFVETLLVSALDKDSLYRVEISLCLDNESNIAIKNFGMLFSNSTLRTDKQIKLISVIPQVEFSSFYLDSASNWITLQSFYKAEGYEKFLVIGNFRPDRNTLAKKRIPVEDKTRKKKWDLTSNEKATYYYIDDVTVEKIPATNLSTDLSPEPVAFLTDTFNIDEMQLDSAIILKHIFFDFDKYDLLPESYTELNKLKHLMASNPAIKIKIEGHTDNVGSNGFNLHLSLKRAESVATYLMGCGIEPSRMITAGYGLSSPLSSNATEEGRRINRRVAFVITEK